MNSIKKQFNVWDSLAKKYDFMWVQKYSLTPTRTKVGKIINGYFSVGGFSLLDLGCGTGQLLYELKEANPETHFFGVDKSTEMIKIARNRNENIELHCADADSDDLTRIFPGNSIDAVICCHSFPYYKNKSGVLRKIYEILAVSGIAIFVQASANNFYDKLILKGVEAKAEKADYLSRKAFLAMTEKYFTLIDEFYIHEKFYMPSILGFVFKKLP